MKIKFKEFYFNESKKDLDKIKNKYISNIEIYNVYEFNDKISVDLIKVKDKNKGTGTSIMKDLCSYADKNNKVIILTPSDEFGSTKIELINFYKKFGFIENENENKIFGIFEEMYRLPK